MKKDRFYDLLLKILHRNSTYTLIASKFDFIKNESYEMEDRLWQTINAQVKSKMEEEILEKTL